MAVTLGESGLVALLWVAALSLAEHQTRRGPAGRRCVSIKDIRYSESVEGSESFWAESSCSSAGGCCSSVDVGGVVDLARRGVRVLGPLPRLPLPRELPRVLLPPPPRTPPRPRPRGSENWA